MTLMSYEKYIHFSTEEFILDDDFMNWVLHPTQETDRHWNDFLKNHPEKKQQVKEAVFMIMAIRAVEPAISEQRLGRVFENIQYSSRSIAHKAFDKFIQIRQKRSAMFIKRVLRVAAVLVPFLFGIYFLFEKDEPAVLEQPVAETTIEPGTSRASLILADGTIVDLEKEENKIITENGTVINNNKKEVVYETGQEQAKQHEVEYNSIEIPRGGEFQLTLSDGTRVWLNSETSIRFPIVFSGKTRDLYLTGEAYFEVAENKDMPFVLHTSGMDIYVTGTAFNVRAYSGEKSTATTLVEGEVNVIQNETKQALRLKPGEQAVVSGLETHVGEVNVEQFIAWKNGRIYFENNSLEEILSNLARWYNVEVNYTDEMLKSLRFSIDVEKYTEFNRVFEIIELTKKVKFRINENQIIVIKGR